MPDKTKHLLTLFHKDHQAQGKVKRVRDEWLLAGSSAGSHTNTRSIWSENSEQSPTGVTDRCKGPDFQGNQGLPLQL